MVNKKTAATFSLLLLFAMTQLANAAPLSVAENHFFKMIRPLCGKAFRGQVKIDKPKSDILGEHELVMHVLKCDANQIRIPFHIGDNASRTWLLTQTSQGITLKHDHRHRDGSPAELTMYGGLSTAEESEQQQRFPADKHSQTLFIKQDMVQSTSNIWAMSIDTNTFTYRLNREDREVVIEFDLTQPVTAPALPWGHQI